jgi:peptidoglycan/xylan/chitin deacetylase (PgdA/CDA1 family)
VVTIAFDDIWASAATTGAAELESRGLPGLFAVTTRFAQNPAQEYASVTAIKALAASPVHHEIASHSADHPFLTTLSDMALKRELADSRTFLEDLGIEVSGLAYPFGDFDHRVEQWAKHQYSWLRTSLYGLNDAQTDRYRLRCFPVTSDTSLETMKGWVDEAKETGTWAILLFHDLGDPQEGNPYLTSARDFADLLDYLVLLGIRVATPRDVPGVPGVAPFTPGD